MIALLPITHSQPDAARTAVEIPAPIKRHLRLDASPSWIICDEQNEFRWPGSDLGRTPDGRTSYGGVPDKFLYRLIEAHREVRRRGALRSASRDE